MRVSSVINGVAMALALGILVEVVVAVLLTCIVAVVLMFQGCTTIALSCPDGKSTLTYKGTNLLSPATTAASCTSNGGGPMASITGTDLSQLAAMVARSMAASQGIPSAPAAAPTPAPEVPKTTFNVPPGEYSGHSVLIEPPPGCYGDGNIIECPEPWTPPEAI